MILLIFAALTSLFTEVSPGRRTIVLRGDTKIEFAYIPAGEFLMGSPDEEANRDADEGPQHKVKITRGFYLGLYEVTQRQWLAVMGKNPSVFRKSADAEDPLDRPIESVSWQDSQRFIDRLNAMGLGRFRLPSEAEWEYAARAGTDSAYSFDGDAHQFAWANSRSMARTHPVGRKAPNAWGLFDMHGNVWEWCSDWYASYSMDSETDPNGPSIGKDKVFRGGSWYDFTPVLRSANRHRHAPDHGYTTIGFRLVLESAVAEEKMVILPGGVAMRFVSIPAGEFSMGNLQSEVGRAQDEGPVRRVTIADPFLIGIYEVTQAQWLAVMNENPSTFTEDGNNPVEMISWTDAQGFLQRMNDLKLGGIFRLPTEAEWEYAARAGTTTPFSFGEDPQYANLPQHAWFYSRAEGRSHIVGSKKPNAWGLFDMHGNVWEWCNDWFTSFSDDQPITDPQGPVSGTHKVIRGGSWFNEPEALRSANRHRHPPDSRQTNLGLRVVWVKP